MKKRWGRWLAVTLAWCLASPAMATNGHFPHGYGTKNKGMGGAGVALPQDAMASATNPAGLAYVGRRVDVGADFIVPPVEYRIDGNAFGLDGSARSETDFVVCPHLGANWPIRERTALGVAFYGNGLMTDYPVAVFGALGSHGRTGLKFTQVIMNSTVAVRPIEQVSIGISQLFSYQEFRARGLQAFGGLSSNANRLTDKGDDDVFGFGLRLGALGKFLDERVAVGVSYQPRIYMRKFDKYAGLFAEHGDLDTPPMFTAGVAVQVLPDVTVVGDYLRINYDHIKSIGNPVSNTLQGTDLFGSDNGAGFGWNDIDVFKAGVQYEVNPRWTLRAGWNHGENPIEDSEMAFNILAPAVVEDHLTFGATKRVGKSGELNIAYVHGFHKRESGQVPAAFGGGTASFSMSMHALEVSYGWEF